MFDIGWAEMLVLGIVVLLVMGPREIPAVLRTIGHYLGRMRALASEFRMHMDNMEQDITATPTQSKREQIESLDLFASPEAQGDPNSDKKQG